MKCHGHRTWLAILSLLFVLHNHPLFAQAGPARVVLVVDSSSDVAPMVNQFRAGLKALLAGIPAETEIAFISTGGQLRVRVPPTTDRARLDKAASSFASDSGANSLTATIVESDQRFLKPVSDRRGIFVILTTDSNPQADASLDRYNDWIGRLGSRRLTAYGVVIRGRAMGIPSQLLENLAQNTRGHSEILALPNGIAEQMSAIADKIAHLE